MATTTTRREKGGQEAICGQLAATAWARTWLEGGVLVVCVCVCVCVCVSAAAFCRSSSCELSSSSRGVRSSSSGSARRSKICRVQSPPKAPLEIRDRRSCQSRAACRQRCRSLPVEGGPCHLRMMMKLRSGSGSSYAAALVFLLRESLRPPASLCPAAPRACHRQDAV